MSNTTFSMKSSGPDDFIGKFSPMFKEESILLLHKLFPKLEEENSTTLIPKPDGDPAGKL